MGVKKCKSMLILADKRIPKKAKSKLKKYGEVLFLETNRITYPAISGHPDIFFCKTGNNLIVAPNTPEHIKSELLENQICLIEGESLIGDKYPETACYNAVITNNILIHHQKYTDTLIRRNSKELAFVHVSQAYTRCNLIPLKANRFITSDKGIEKNLADKGYTVLYVNPKGILLPGFENGFIGGTCGIYQNKIFFLGSLEYFREGDIIRNFLSDYEIVELYDGPLFDGGSLIFV